MGQLTPILTHSSTVPRQQPAGHKVNSSPRSVKLQHLTRLDYSGSKFFLPCINLKKWHILYQQLPKKMNERFSFSQLIWAKIQKLVQTFISQLADVLLTSFYLLFIRLCVHILMWMWTQHTWVCNVWGQASGASSLLSSCGSWAHTKIVNYLQDLTGICRQKEKYWLWREMDSKKLR